MTEVAMARVKDLTANESAREHDLIEPDGSVKRYTFLPRQYHDVPLATATRFLVGNDAFEVLGPDGRILKLVAQPQQAVQGAGLIMRPDQVIASLDELTADALVARCHAKGGAKLTKTSGKKTLVEFLMGGGGQAAAAGPVDDLPEDEKLGHLVKPD